MVWGMLSAVEPEPLIRSHTGVNKEVYKQLLQLHILSHLARRAPCICNPPPPPQPSCQKMLSVTLLERLRLSLKRKICQQWIGHHKTLT